MHRYIPASGEDPRAVFYKIQPGDEIEIVSDKYKTRKVIVTERYDDSNVFTSSGKVLPGRIAGGRLADHAKYGEGIVFQPTMQQQISHVRSLRILRRAGQRN